MKDGIDNLIEILKDKREQYGIGVNRLDSKRVCEGLGVDMEELVFILSGMVLKGTKEDIRARDKINELERENERLKEYIERKGANGREQQMDRVRAGLPIAKKKSKSLAELELLEVLKNSDTEIMKHFGISRTTLWRWKKELEEVKRSRDKLERR